MLFSLLLCAVISSAYAPLPPCPKLKGADNFDPATFYTGRWYEVARIPNVVEGRGDCVYIETALDENANYVTKLTEVFENKYRVMESMTYVDPDSPAVIDYFSRNISTTEKIAMISLTVLAYDPDNYVVNYECINDEAKNIHHEYGWILARKNKLEGAPRKAVDAFIDATPFLSKEKYLWDHFDEATCKVTG